MFMMSPQTGLPTSPTPLGFSISPTFRGFLKWSMTLSLYIAASFLPALLVERGHVPEFPDNLWQDFEHEVHIRVRVHIAQREPERTMRDLHRQAGCEQDMGGFERTGGAGTPG